MHNVVLYNEKEVKKVKEFQEIVDGYNVWVDLIDPTPQELEDSVDFFMIDY